MPPVTLSKDIKLVSVSVALSSQVKNGDNSKINEIISGNILAPADHD